MEFVRVRLKYCNCLTINKMGRSGGLALLWSKDINISVFSYSVNHIDVMVHDYFRNI